MKSKPERKQRIPKKGPLPPITQLKQRPPADREWAFELRDKMSAEAARAAIKGKLGVALGSDTAYQRFCQWQWRQRVADHLSEMMSEDEDLLRDKFPGQSRDAIRNAAIKRGYAIADLQGDVKLSMMVVGKDLEDGRQSLDREKFQFDAAKACLAKLPELKAISNNKGLSDTEKVEQVRLKLFGVVPQASAS